MVRTRGGHRYRPRVRFSTLERDDTGTSRAADAHSPDLPAETQPALAPVAIPEEAQTSEPHPGDIRPGGTSGPFPRASETMSEGPSLQAGLDIRSGGVFEISA